MDDVIKISFTVGTLIVAYFFGAKLSKLRNFSFLSERKGRYGSIDGLRGYLAIAVFFHHFIITWYWKNTGKWTRPPEDYFQNYGKVGVAIFFMITGFLFVSKLLKDQGKTDWFKLFESRFFRIFPLYLFSLFIITVVVFYKQKFELYVEPIKLIKEYIRWFVFYGGRINDFSETKQIIAGVDWTLKYEWLFYISLPFIAQIIRLGKVVSIVILIGCLGAFLFPISKIGVSSTYFILFAVGAICAYLAHTKLAKNKIFSSHLFSIISTLLLVLSLIYPSTFSLMHIAIISMFFFIISLGNDMFGLLSKRPSILLGEISYSIYLLHGVVLYFSFTLFNITPLDTVGLKEYLFFMPLLCVLVIMSSVLTYLFIEVPLIKYGKCYFISGKIKKMLTKKST